MLWWAADTPDCITPNILWSHYCCCCCYCYWLLFEMHLTMIFFNLIKKQNLRWYNLYQIYYSVRGKLWFLCLLCARSFSLASRKKGDLLIWLCAMLAVIRRRNESDKLNWIFCSPIFVSWLGTYDMTWYPLVGIYMLQRHRDSELSDNGKIWNEMSVELRPLQLTTQIKCNNFLVPSHWVLCSSSSCPANPAIL
jgi:hypothetical protein